MSEAAQTTSTPNTTTVVGGLSDGMVANPTAAAPKTETTPASPAKKFVLHGREFDSPEQAIAYAEGLTANRPAAPATVEAAPAVVRRKPSEILFEDPEAAIAALKDEVKAEMRSEGTNKANVDNAWKSFYENNSDLKGFEEEVEIQRQKHIERIKTMSLDDAGKLLATETRARLAKIRGTANQGEHIPSRAATVAGSSGATPPVVTAPVTATTSFIDDVKAMQARRSKKTN